MTNREIADLANSSGFNAYFKNGGVYIFLKNRKVGMLEIERALDIPYEVMCHADGGVIVYGIDS